MKYDGPGFYGLQPPPWAGSVSIAKGQWLTSPADNEIYQRIAATGTDTLDPADDIVKYVARSYERTSALASGNIITSSGLAAAIGGGATKTTVGALAVGARTNVLSVTGRGHIDYLAYNKAASGSARVEVFVDGRSVLDQTDAGYATTASLLAIGMLSAGATTGAALAEARFDPRGVQFRRTLEVYITNTATIGGAGAVIVYHLGSAA